MCEHSFLNTLSLQVSHSACQLEISVLSCQPACFISEQVSKLTETLDLNNLKVRNDKALYAGRGDYVMRYDGLSYCMYI